MSVDEFHGVNNPLGRCFAWTPHVTTAQITDYDAVLRSVEHAMTLGVDAGVFGAGLSGGWVSQPDETISLVARVRRSYPDFYAMMGALDTNVSRLCDTIRGALQEGNNAPQEFMVAMPRLHDDMRFWPQALEHVQTVMGTFPEILFTLYENGAYGPASVPPAELLTLKRRCPNFVRIKSSTEPWRIMQLLAELPERGIEVVTGFDTLIIPMALQGVRSYIGGSDFVFQREFALAHRLAVASCGEADPTRQATLAGAAMLLHNAMLPCLNLDDQRIPVVGWQGQPSFIAYLVAAEAAASRLPGNVSVRDNQRLYPPMPLADAMDSKLIEARVISCQQALDQLPHDVWEELLAS